MYRKNLTSRPPENSVDADNRYFNLLEGKNIKQLETKDMKKDGTVFDVGNFVITYIQSKR